MVAGARRRAVRDGDRQIDTAHLLHSLLEHDPEVRAAVGDPQRLARLLGYLVQRSIGYGLRWQGSVEDSGAIVVPAPARSLARDTRDAPAWSPAAAAAMSGARERARHRGELRPAGTDLLAALAADPGARAVEVLERAGISALDLGARIDAGTEEYAGDGSASC
ncbi:peptidase [Streptomyces monashensis]|uniref:Peptidase n=1 Tax=Streptomyces monashensis TaxID=1678012 RepID=A0A1S2QK95_9ACTN|nr:peptidase [Streptomyces monashensis]